MDNNRLLHTLQGILWLIGNVDHSKGNGPNSARQRGDMLNSIRDIARTGVRYHVTTTQIKNLEDSIKILENNPQVLNQIEEAQIAGMESVVEDMKTELEELRKQLDG